MLDEDASRLIGDLYAGAHDKRDWDVAIEAMCARLGVKWAMLGVFDERARAPIAPDFYGAQNSRFHDGLRDYDSDLFRLDPTNAYCARHPAGGVFDSLEQLGREDYRSNDYVQFNQTYFGSTFWRLHYAGRDGLRLGLSLHNDERDGPMTNARGRLAALFFEHVRNAAWLAARAPTPDGPDPVILLDRRGELVGASAAALALIAANDALALIDRKPRALARGSAAAFDRVIGGALNAPATGDAGGSAVLERRDGVPLFVTVTPLPRELAPLAELRPAVLIRLVDPAAAPAASGADWRALFGFTPAECRLAGTLLAGDGNLRAAADRLGIAYPTARAQLASLFEKADVRSQVQLVRLMTRLR